MHPQFGSELSQPQALMMPIVVERGVDGERSYDLASRLLQDRNIVLDSGFNSNMAHITKLQLLYLDSRSAENINIYVNSPGGSVHDGLSIKDIAESSRSPITTIGNGMCASMGCYMLSVIGDEGRRIMSKRAYVMCHQVSSGTQGHIADQEISLEHTKKLNQLLMGEIADRVGVKLEKLMEDAKRDIWFSAEEALNYGKNGFCDGVLTGKRNEKGQFEILRRKGNFEWL